MNPTHGIAVAKGVERYVFLFAADQRSEVLRVAGRWASDPALSFDWHDAAAVSAEVRRSMAENLGEQVNG